MKTKSQCLPLGILLSLLWAASACADNLLWTGLTFDGLWSTGGNWTNLTAGSAGTAPSAADDVRFHDSGSTSPLVDGAFGGTIASLWFGSTNNDYTTTITTALNLTGTGGLRVGTPGDTGTAVVRTAAFSGSGATLNLNNPDANLVLNQGTGTAANGSRAILNLENLDTFTASLRAIGLGTLSHANAVGQRNSGTLYLARTNLIVLNYAVPLATYQTSGAATNAIEMVNVKAGNPPVALSFLYLGQTNAFFVDSIGVGRSKASTTSAGTIAFNPNFIGNGAVAYFRGIGGDASRVTWWAAGDMANDASSAQHAVGTNNFTGGRVDALVDVMSLGRDCGPNHTATGGGRINTGVLTFEDGIIDVNTLIVGNQSLANAGSTSVTPNHGYVNINSANATLVVNQTLKLADTSAQTHTAAQQTFGRVNVNGGTLRAHTITVGANTITNAILDLSNSGTLVVSNTIASATKPLRNLNASDSTIVLNLTGAATIGHVTNLLTSGGGNTLHIGQAVTFPSYPAQVALFKYHTLSNDVSGNGTHNFVLGSVPGNVVNAYLSNNTFNSSLDLVLPTDPRPVVTTEPSGFSGAPGSTVILSAVVEGVSPLIYQWRRSGTNISDGGNRSGTGTDTLTINNAQVADSGSYTLVINNAYGTTTSAVATVTISAGNVAPSITGPVSQSVLQGETAVFTASVSGVPAPALQWFKNGAPLGGQTSSTLTLVNVQFPTDQAVYSLRATNVAGIASNSASLTVLVPPVITVEPTSVVVPQGSPAAFTVTATGNPAPGYQWSKNNNTLPNATNATLNFASVQPADAGSYAVLISNAGGSTNSVTVTLTVTSTTLSYTNVSPADNATGIGYDTPLYMRFNTPPVLGTGTLRIYDSGDNLVDTIDLSLNQANNGQIRTIAGQAYYTLPVIIRSNTAAIFPHLGVMTSNTTYYVLMDTGFFKDAGGASMVGISSATAWNFTTKLAGPDPDTVTNIVVAADGSGDFVTVQGAIDWVPAGNTTPRTITLKKGVYEEINRIPAGKNNLTFLGEGCQESIITYANNNAFQLANAGTATRIMFFAGGNDCVFKNLWFANSTPQGGSQAEAIRVQGLRIIADNCKFTSFQDTILINTANTSSGYFNKSLIQGDVDFIWGSGIGYFKQCEVRAMQRAGNSAGVYTQARTGAGVYGFIFVDCDLTRSATNMVNWSLSRDANTSGPYGNVAWLKCRMDDHIGPFGWTDGGLADKSTLRFWEYQSRNITDTALVDVSGRVAWSSQLTASEYETHSNPTNVFATIPGEFTTSWEPTLSPYVACQPKNQSAVVGQTVTIAAAIGGIPEPVYRWYKGASPVPNGTNENLVIPNAQISDSGTYSLRVTNDLGFAITENAVLTVAPAAAPAVSNPVKLENGSFQFTFSGTAGQPYRIWGASDVGLAPVPSTWSLLGSGNFAGSPELFTDTTATNATRRFYVISVP